MRRLAFAFLLFASTLALEALAARPEHEALRALASVCAPAQIAGCDTENYGALQSGDCLFDDGTRFDTFDFDGTAGQTVNITLRPLSATYTKPWITLISPAGDVSEPPVIHGGSGGATLLYQLSSSGRWRIALSSDDVIAGGDYVLHFYCGPPAPAGQPQSCISQELLCGQEGRWTLTAESCRFSGVNKVYASWLIYGVQGDVLQIAEESLAFEPLFGVYDQRTGELLKSSTRDSSIKASMRFTVPKTAWYEILTTTVQEGRGGEFFITVACSKSGCVFPYLVNPIPTIVAEYGKPATIPFVVNAVGGFTASLRQDLAPVATSTTSSITTPPVTSLQRYVLDLDNACGGWSSGPFIVMSDRLSKKRTVRR